MVILSQYYKYEKVWEKAKRQRPWNLTEVLKLDGSLQKTTPKDIQHYADRTSSEKEIGSIAKIFFVRNSIK